MCWLLFIVLNASYIFTSNGMWYILLSLILLFVNFCPDTVLKVFKTKQDAVHKFLIEDRDRQIKTAKDQQTQVKKQHEHKGQPEDKIQDQKEAPKEKKSTKLFPKSALFTEWGENLSEADQTEAQVLFQKYGYNVFLSDRLPLDRALPDTRDPRYSQNDCLL